MSHAKTWIFVFVFITSILFACGGVDQRKESENQSVRYKKEQINQNISVEEAYEMIKEFDGDTMFVLVDIRSDEEFEGGIIEDAVTLEFKDPELNEKLDTMHREKIYIVYCRTGRRSGITIAEMKEMGFLEVYSMKGGIVRWRQEGFEFGARY